MLPRHMQPLCRVLWEAFGSFPPEDLSPLPPPRIALLSAALAHQTLMRLLLPDVPQDPLHVRPSFPTSTPQQPLRKPPLRS